MDALDQLGFSGNMLYYHIHLVARKLECEHAHRGEAVNVIARYWRYAGWHLPAPCTPNTLAGFDDQCRASSCDAGSTVAGEPTLATCELEKARFLQVLAIDGPPMAV